MSGACRQAVCILMLSVLLAACSSKGPVWRSKVAPFVEELGRIETPVLFPKEYQSLLETFEHGEALYHVRKDEKGADVYYQLALRKAEILQLDVNRIKKQLAAEKQRQIAEQAAKAAEEELMRAAEEAEIRLRAQQAAEEAKSEQKKNKSPLTTSYTVRRGETLPQISARSEIYNDSSLWPIIYRANRDQIRDPKRLWPGQVFVIPRNFSRDEADQARRYSIKNSKGN